MPRLSVSSLIPVMGLSFVLQIGADANDKSPVQTRLIATSILPRVALEYGQVWWSLASIVPSGNGSVPSWYRYGVAENTPELVQARFVGDGDQLPLAISGGTCN